jgi:hypothetical protein
MYDICLLCILIFAGFEFMFGGVIVQQVSTPGGIH